MSNPDAEFGVCRGQPSGYEAIRTAQVRAAGWPGVERHRFLCDQVPITIGGLLSNPDEKGRPFCFVRTSRQTKITLPHRTVEKRILSESG